MLVHTYEPTHNPETHPLGRPGLKVMNNSRETPRPAARLAHVSPALINLKASQLETIPGMKGVEVTIGAVLVVVAVVVEVS